MTSTISITANTTTTNITTEEIRINLVDNFSWIVFYDKLWAPIKIVSLALEQAQNKAECNVYIFCGIHWVYHQSR